MVFRENTEGVYVGVGGQVKRGTPDEIAINEDVNTRKGVERIIRAAFEFAKASGRKRVHMADKSNAMRHAHELWLRVFDEVRREYADLQATHVYIDALCLYMVQDPSQFDVVVTNNLFGDIVTDLGAAFQGGLGMAASANVHPAVPGRVGLFEPVHGSAPPWPGRTSRTRSQPCSRWACCSRTWAGPKKRPASRPPWPTPSRPASARQTSGERSAPRRPAQRCGSGFRWADPPLAARGSEK